MKPKLLFFRRACSVLIDLSAVYSAAVLLQALIYLFTFVEFSTIFVTTLLVYYVMCYWLGDGQTPGRRLTRITVRQMDARILSVKTILLREVVLKGVVCIIFPFFILQQILPIWSLIQMAFVVVIILLISLLFLLLKKRQWWEVLSGTATMRGVYRRTGRVAAFAVVALLFIAAIFVTNYPNWMRHKNPYRTYLPSYPITKETTAYAQFINQHGQDPVEYVFDLFKTHDVVVLSERIHPECTQYELMERIISDKRFTDSIGNLFTECGSVSFQDTLTSYLHTTYASERDLNKATAELQRNSNAIWPLWTNTNLFDLFKTVNKLNTRLADTSKIAWYFTDLAVDWQTMSREKFLSGYTNANRDSLMAVHIIVPFNNIISKQRRRKALVIMNTRHGYGLVDEKRNLRFTNEYMGTTAHLMKNLPGGVANVFLNSVSIQYGVMFTPIQHGKWDRAFALAGNRNIGFNFSGSPFGEDKFDAGFFSGRNIQYKDVFTGFIFYKPLGEHYVSNGFPFEFDGFEDSILKRAAYVDAAQVQGFREQIKFYKKHTDNPVTTEPLQYAVVYNLVTVKGVTILLLTVLLLAVLSLFFLRRRREINEDQITGSSVSELPEEAIF